MSEKAISDAGKTGGAAGSTPPGGIAHEGVTALLVGAIGVVFGDIGTSPLYAFRECFSGQHGLPADPTNILGVLSLIFWSLILIISIKYLVFFLRADNRGEGGILALSVLVSRYANKKSKAWAILLGTGIFGAALLYGDGIITPAISVLSAVEGLNVATAFFQPYVVYIAVAVLTGLFMVQRSGSARIGAVFGPVLMVWFLALAVLGVRSVVESPSVLTAVNPLCALEVFVHNRGQGFVILGTVFLAVTGGEVLYADMGHFGKTPIRQAWFSIVLPALMLNYFGQAAYLLRHPGLHENLLYRLAPSWMLYPLVVLATAATVIASQSVISGAYSLTRQAIQLGYWPRMSIRHTSSSKIGQVYAPGINWALCAGTIALVLVFRNSGSLAGAYGVAVAATMMITTILAVAAAPRIWHVRLPALIPVAALFLLINLAFLASCLLKIKNGGWIPLLIGSVIYLTMTVWKEGRRLIGERIEAESLSQGMFLDDVARRKPTRVPGVAVFLTGNETGIPRTLLHNFRHNKILHDQTVLTTIRTEEIPYVPEPERTVVRYLGQGFYRVTLYYGFSEEPNIPLALSRVTLPGLAFTPSNTTYFLGGETLICGKNRVLSTWRSALYAFMSRNAFDATQYYQIPPNRVVVLGIQLEL